MALNLSYSQERIKYPGSSNEALRYGMEQLRKREVENMTKRDAIEETLSSINVDSNFAADVQTRIKGYQSQIDTFINSGGDMADAGDLLYNMTGEIRRDKTIKDAVISTGALSKLDETVYSKNVSDVFKKHWSVVGRDRLIQSSNGPVSVQEGLKQTMYPEQMDIHTELLKHLKTINPNITGEIVSELMMNPLGDYDAIAAKYGMPTGGINDLRAGHNNKYITYEGLVEEAVRYGTSKNTRLGQYTNAITNAMNEVNGVEQGEEAALVTADSIIKSYIGKADDLWSSSQEITNVEELNLNSAIFAYAKAGAKGDEILGKGVVASTAPRPFNYKQKIAVPRDDYEATGDILKLYSEIGEGLTEDLEAGRITDGVFNFVTALLSKKPKDLRAAYDSKISDMLKGQDINLDVLNKVERYMDKVSMLDDVREEALGTSLYNRLNAGVTQSKNYPYETRGEVVEQVEFQIRRNIRNNIPNFDQLDVEQRNAVIDSEFDKFLVVFDKVSDYTKEIGDTKNFSTEATVFGEDSPVRELMSTIMNTGIVDVDPFARDGLQGTTFPLSPDDLMSLFVDRAGNVIPMADRRALSKAMRQYAKNRKDIGAAYEERSTVDQVGYSYTYLDPTYAEERRDVILANLKTREDNDGKVLMVNGNPVKETEVYDSDMVLLDSDKLTGVRSKNKIIPNGLTDINGQYFETFRIDESATGNANVASALYFMPVDAENVDYANINFLKGKLGDKAKERYMRDMVGDAYAKNGSMDLKVIGLNGSLDTEYNSKDKNFTYTLNGHGETENEVFKFTSLNDLVKKLMILTKPLN